MSCNQDRIWRRKTRKASRNQIERNVFMYIEQSSRYRLGSSSLISDCRHWNLCSYHGTNTRRSRTISGMFADKPRKLFVSSTLISMTDSNLPPGQGSGSNVPQRNSVYYLDPVIFQVGFPDTLTVTYIDIPLCRLKINSSKCRNTILHDIQKSLSRCFLFLN